MYNYKKQKLPKNTTQLVVDVPKADIKKEEEDAFVRLQQKLTVEGFRQGKVPKTIAEKHIHKDDLYQELAQKMISRIYQELLAKEGLRPIISPKVDLVKAKEGEDWQIKITVAEKPTITLGDYKKVIKEVKSKVQKSNIWVPGKDKEAKKPEEDNSKLLNEVLTALLNESKIEVSDLVIDDEVNHRLTHLIDEIQKIGLTTEKYLKSKNLTIMQKAGVKKNWCLKN